MYTWLFYLIPSLLVLTITVMVYRRRTPRAVGTEDAPHPAPREARLAHAALTQIGTTLVPESEPLRTRLQTRLHLAGLYGRQAMLLFLGVKVLLTIVPLALGIVLGSLKVLPLLHGVILGCILSLTGSLGMNYWLHWRKAHRQERYRRALPDFLDVLIICLEGGLSLPDAFRRVVKELQTAYPEFAAELSIVQRETDLGQPLEIALQRFAERTDLEELRSLATVIFQTERYGGGIVRTLRAYAEGFRAERVQKAEEKAGKAAVKILFPTLLLIFPGVFVIILGPALIQIKDMLQQMRAPAKHVPAQMKMGKR